MFIKQRSVINCLTILAAVISIGLLSGCEGWLDAGLNLPDEYKQGKAEYRTEMETIPNANLAREDTMPRWQLGRHAFKRGIHRLVVLTHFTAVAPVDAEGPDLIFADRTMERVWITIPEGTKLGQELNVEDLIWDKVTGYDAGDVGDGQFIEPYRVTGSLAVLEYKSESVVVYLNLLVAPKRRPNWSVKGRFEIPQTNTGIHTSMIEPGPLELYNASPTLTQSPANEIASPPEEIEAPTTMPAVAATQPAEAPPAPAVEPPSPAEGQDTPTNAVTDPAEIINLAGTKWLYETSGWYERMQFNVDNTFIHASSRSRGEPSLNFGRYDIKGNFIVLTTTVYTFGSLKAGNLQKDLPKPETGLLKYSFIGNKLHLEGKASLRGMRNINLTMEPAAFPDMATVPPPVKE